MKFFIVLILLINFVINQQAPSTFDCIFETTMGNATLHVKREWAPFGVDRFYELVNEKYYDDNGLFRYVSNFVVQWGINGDPAVSAKWRNRNIQDDPVKLGNKR
jgi:peptidyl-prolyl cis-trans isomerase A (cyclophilin A)